ncbi:MAG: hypothetical protein HQM06_10935 [Magnetococcales bacterium]|nr:hypothetical protein [Magnetococcales bacterium]
MTRAVWRPKAVLQGVQLHWQGDVALWLLQPAQADDLAVLGVAEREALRAAMALLRACLQWGPQEGLQRVTERAAALFAPLHQGATATITLWLDGEGVSATHAPYLFCYSMTIAPDEAGTPALQQESLRRYGKAWLQDEALLHFPADVQPQVVLEKGSELYYDCFLKEGSCRGECGRFDSFWFGRQQSTLYHVPQPRDRYPTAHAVREFLLSWIG